MTGVCDIITVLMAAAGFTAASIAIVAVLAVGLNTIAGERNTMAQKLMVGCATGTVAGLIIGLLLLVFKLSA